MASLLLGATVAEDDRVGTTELLGRHVPARAARRTVETAVDDTTDGSQKSRLDLVIEAEIIPRLMVAHSISVGQVAYQDPPVQTTLDEVDIDAFIRHVLKDDIAVAFAFIDALRDQGLPMESVFLDILTPAARRLGTLWETDDVTFADVTVGLSKLQQILRVLSPGSGVDEDARPVGRRILLAAVPGDQHTFGVFMVEEFFRRAGWDVVTCVMESSSELAELVSAEPFDVIGFSTSNDELIPVLERDVPRLVKGSRNPEIRILVGGGCFRDNPALVKQVGADGTAADGREAVALAAAMVDDVAAR